MTIPSVISDQEKLARSIFSKSIARRAPNRIIHNLFLEKKGEKTISVDRFDVAPVIDELVGIGDKIAENRNKEAFLYGWAVITAEKASDSERKVLYSPQPENPYHADIILPDEVVKNREEQKMHAQQLADNAIWHKRP